MTLLAMLPNLRTNNLKGLGATLTLGLQLRNKTPKRRVRAKLRNDRCSATRSNET